MLRIASMLLGLLTLSGCSNIQTDRAYQELGRAEQYLQLQDAFLIGFEKRDKDIVSNKPVMGVYQDLVFPLEPELATPISSADLAQQNKKFQGITQHNTKVMLATQVVENFDGLNFIYNAYAGSKNGTFDYQASLNGLLKLQERLTARLAGDNYSHLILMSMGWNNDQFESFRRFNIIKKQLTASAQDDFKPLVIGVSWPSAWSSISDSWVRKKLGHLVSYGNKANDADEIGFTLLNLLINRLIPESLQAAGATAPKFVVLGHSFGARVTSRALFASAHLKQPKAQHSAVDLYIGLQSAFSVNRFIPDAGAEGAPYQNAKALGVPIVLTTSEYDRANPIAHYVTRARHVGGRYGLETAKACLPESSPCHGLFEVHTWSNNSNIPLSDDKVMIIDAKSIVTGEKNQNGEVVDGHNDILDREMGELIWHFIRQLDGQ